MEGRSSGPLLAEEMAFEWVCAPWSGGNHPRGRAEGGGVGGTRCRGRKGGGKLLCSLLPSLLPSDSFRSEGGKGACTSLHLWEVTRGFEGRWRTLESLWTVSMVTNLPLIPLFSVSRVTERMKEEHVIRTHSLGGSGVGFDFKLQKLCDLPSATAEPQQTRNTFHPPLHTLGEEAFSLRCIPLPCGTGRDATPQANITITN